LVLAHFFVKAPQLVKEPFWSFSQAACYLLQFNTFNHSKVQTIR